MLIPTLPDPPSLYTFLVKQHKPCSQSYVP